MCVCQVLTPSSSLQNTLDMGIRTFVVTSSIAAIVGGMGMAGE